MLRQLKQRLALSVYAWRRIKYPVGYGLFAIAITYGLWHAPSELWQLSPFWLLLSLVVVVLMFLLQQWQVTIFLRAYGLNPGWLYPALFNARRGLLNMVLPARSGTLFLVHDLTKKYPVTWRDFLYFFLVAGIVSVYVSGLALAWLLWPWGYSAALLFGSLIAAFYLARRGTFQYAAWLPNLLLLALALYLATVTVLFFLLRGLGYQLSFVEVSYLAIALNVLAQVSITPGNIGVREVLMGLIAPFVELPVAVGIIASSLLLIIRLIVYGIFWVLLEGLLRRPDRRDSNTIP